MKLCREGFFRELPYGEGSGASIQSAIGTLADEDVNAIIKYLDAGHAIMVAPGLSKNVLSERNEIIGGLTIKTDGKFAWPQDLSFYVKNYRVGLSHDFLDHMKMKNWSIGDVNIEYLEI